MLGMGHPSSPPVAEFNRTKSRVKRHFWGWPSGVGLGTRWTWLHSVACDSLMTPSSKSASTCFRISSECLRGGARLHGSRHSSSSITIFSGSTAAGSLRILVANTSINSRNNDEPLHSALEVALVSLRTKKATVGGELACEVPCGCGVHGWGYAMY